ncbi:MAG: hypothetical protein AAFV53_37995, partial [Myxococcota bacterium]
MRWLTLLLLGSACATPPDQRSWRDQLQPAGPCWRVDLSDGLDESSTDEIEDLYRCLNQSGNFDAFGPTIDAMAEPDRDTRPVGVNLAQLVNRLGDTDIDVFNLAGLAVTLIQEQPDVLRRSLDLIVELTYGLPADEAVVVSDADVLDRGVLRPALGVLPALAAVMLDEPSALPAQLGEALQSDTLLDALCLLTAMHAPLKQTLLPDLGDALRAAQSPSNDRSALASGDSLRDLTEALLVERLDGQTLGEAIDQDVTTLLQDPRLRASLVDVLETARRDRRLRALPEQAMYLASVDVGGGVLQDGEDSALTRLLRLLAASDAPLDCRVTVLGVEIFGVSVDNLAVEILNALARQDPDTAIGVLDLLGGALGLALTETVLNTVVNSGVCPLLSPQLQSDLDAIERLNDDEVADLLVVLLDGLEALAPDRTAPLVGVVATVNDRGTVPLIEEALRDLGDHPAADGAMQLLEQMLVAENLDAGSCPAGATPLNMDDALGVLADGADQTAGTLQPLLDASLSPEETWVAIDNLGGLLRQD